ncbi:MAG: DUF4160 domain-containing protein [Acidobacteriaceae bacterium]
MPTVLRIGNLLVVIYSNDHRPAHVHIIGADSEALFVLGCPGRRVRLRENYGFARRELTIIEKKLAEHSDELCQAWEEIHGHAD